MQERLKPREYQKKGEKIVIKILTDRIRGKVRETTGNYESGILIEMATWSWKTFLTWEIMNHILKLRNKARNNPSLRGIFPERFNVVILTNRIDWLEQFRDDLVEGRNWKSPIIEEQFLKNISKNTFHSKADDLDGFIQDKYDELEKDERSKDNFYFSTFQTAELKKLADKLENIDMIIIDEAHNVWEEWTYQKVIDDLIKKWRNWVSPVIYAVTATPDNKTKKIFWESSFEYWLSKYLASEYSPKVKYNITIWSSVTVDEIKSIEKMLQEATSLEDIKEKRKFVSELEKKFNGILERIPSIRHLCQDILSKIKTENKEIEKTIIFASSIEEADEIAENLNKQTWKEVALSYHSKNERIQALEELKKWNIKIIVSVDKLNESVDLPTISNVIFYRMTDSPKIYFQQLWRWLRGKWELKYYDYVWVLKNIQWVWNIYEEYKEELEKNKEKKSKENLEKKNFNSKKTDKSHLDTELDEEENFSLSGSVFNTSEVSIGLYNLANKIVNLKEEVDKPTKLEIISYFRWNRTEEEWQKLSENEKNEVINHWFNMKNKEKDNIEINWCKLTEITRIMNARYYDKNWNKVNPIDNKIAWVKFLNTIFWVNLEIKKLGKEEIIFYFRWNRTEEEWQRLSENKKNEIINNWLNMTNRKRNDIIINWAKLSEIASILNANYYDEEWNKVNPVDKKIAWIKLLNAIFWVNLEIEKLSKEEIIFYFRWNRTEEEWQRLSENKKNEIINNWLNMTNRKRNDIIINWAKLSEIANIMDANCYDEKWNKLHPNRYKEGWIKLLDTIFWNDFQIAINKK